MRENFESRSRVWEAEKRNIEELIATAEAEAPTEAAADFYQEQVSKATARYIAGTTSLSESMAETATIKPLPGGVLFDTLPEYRYGLECAGFTPQEIDNTLAHENDHMLVAQATPGVELHYQLQFMTTEAGVAMRPSVLIQYPDGFAADNEGHRQAMIQIISAPDVLSDGDTAMLDNESGEE